MISALTGDGVADLKPWLAARMPPGPWLYPADQMSDAPLRQLAAEITREKLFERLHQELPYHSTVETEVWKELRNGDIRIEQTIYVERESQRKIVLGKGGATIKAIGEAARKEIAEIAEAKVHLFLFVKVREGWGDDPERYRAMGLEFPRRSDVERTKSMQWTDEGIVLGVKRHGEASAILELMTREHGRHLGLVRGGFGSRMKPVLQPGNTVSATWRARLDEHLGNYTVEGLRPARRRVSSRASHAIYGVDASRRADAAVARARSACRPLCRTRRPSSTASTMPQCGGADGGALRAAAAGRARLRPRPRAVRRDRRDRRSDLCVAEIGPRGVAHRRRAVGRPDAAAAGFPRATPMRRPAAAISPTASRSPASSSTRHVLEPRGLALADERAHFIAALERALPSVA